MEVKMVELPCCHEKIGNNITKRYIDGQGKERFQVVKREIDCTACKYGKEMSNNCGFFKKPMVLMESKQEEMEAVKNGN